MAFQRWQTCAGREQQTKPRFSSRDSTKQSQIIAALLRSALAPNEAKRLRMRGWAAAGGQIFTVAAFAKQSQFSPRRGTSRSGDEHPPGAFALRYGAKRNLHKRRAATALAPEDENVNGTRRR